jgi:hypothetical protein
MTDFNWALMKGAEAKNVKKVLANWERRRKRQCPDEWPEVLKAFKASTHTVLYRLTLDLVEEAAKDTEHALGSVKAYEARKHRDAADVSPAYPIIMLFYDLMERQGRIPRWKDVQTYLFEHQSLCLAYFYKACGIPAPTSISHMWKGEKLRAIRFRIGCLYYSFLREVHTLVALRERHGLDARYHPLQDAEWKADILVNLVRVELFLVNPKYKERCEREMAGRKLACEAVNPGLPVVIGAMEPGTCWGEAWLFSDETIDGLAQDIKKAMIAN